VGDFGVEIGGGGGGAQAYQSPLHNAKITNAWSYTPFSRTFS